MLFSESFYKKPALDQQKFEQLVSVSDKKKTPFSEKERGLAFNFVYLRLSSWEN